MIKPRYLIGFTGHRSGYDEAIIRPALTQLLRDLKERAAKTGGQAELYSSVAEGGDTLCVEVARDLDMPVHLLLPLEEREFEKDFSSPASWQRSLVQIKAARQRPGRDSVRLVPGEFQRPDCYFDQAMHMLGAADVMVALWDGQPSRGVGGTKRVVEQAQAIGTPVVRIASHSGVIEGRENLDVCFEHDPVITKLNEMARHNQAPCAQAPGTADDLQKCLDAIAVAEVGRFRPSLVAIILLHGLAALLAAIVTFKLAVDTPWEKSKWVFTGIELFLVSFALWMNVRLHQKHTQERWIRCRFSCELVRGLRFSVPLLDPLHLAIGVHDPQWRRFALSVGLLVNEYQTTTQTFALRDRYIAIRLSETHKEGQIRHYHDMRPRALWWWDLTGYVSKWSTILAPPFVLLSLLNKLSKNADPEHIGWALDGKPATWPLVVLFPIVLPLFAGVANGIRQALDAGRRKKSYPEMAARLTVMRANLSGLETRATIVRAVSQTEEILLNELREWQLAATTTRP